MKSSLGKRKSRKASQAVKHSLHQLKGKKGNECSSIYRGQQFSVDYESLSGTLASQEYAGHMPLELP
jgi:hypothetical protein